MEKNLKPKLYFYFCVIITLLGPGLGHIFWGQAFLGLGILSFLVLFSLGSSYFAVLGTWAAAIVIILMIGIYTGALYSLVKLTRQPLKKCYILAGIGLFFVLIVTEDFHRVRFFTVPSPVLEPLILEGDSIAIDRSEKIFRDLKVGDIIAVKLPERSGIYIRKVQSLNGHSIIVVANDPQIPEQDVPSYNVVGRALYVLYSFDSERKMLRWDRILKPSF